MARRPITFAFRADTGGMAAGLQAGQAALRRMGREVEQLDRAAARLGEQSVRLDVDTSSMSVLRTRLQAMRADLTRDLEINPDVDVFQAIAKLKKVERELSRLDRMEAKARVKVDLDRDASSVLGRATKLGTQVGEILGGGISQGIRTAVSTPQGAAATAAVGAALAPWLAAAGTLVATQVAGIAGAGVTGGVAALGRRLLEETASLDAVNRKFSTVFGEMSESFEQFVRGLSGRAGIGRQDLKGLAAGVQDLLVPQGYSRADAAAITREVVNRGVALARYSGVDAARGIEAVTAALLGEREQLKGLGVSISQEEVNTWIEDNASALRGLSDAQRTTAATTALIAAKSADAAAEWERGGTAAQQLAGQLRAAFANLRTDALEGLAPIVNRLVSDLDREFDVKILFSDGGLKAWIDGNADRIYRFFLSVGDAALTGARLAVSGFDAMLGAAEALVPTILNVARAAAIAARPFSYLAQAAAVLANPVAGVKLGGMFDDFRAQADAAVQGIDSVRREWDEWQPQRQELRANLDGWSADLRSAQQKAGELRAVADVRVALQQGDLDTARAQLARLSDKRIAQIIADTRGSDDAVDKRLNRIARAERRARIGAEAVGTLTAAQRLDALRFGRDGRDRRAGIVAALRGADGVRIALNGLVTERTATIRVRYVVDSFGDPLLRPGYNSGRALPQGAGAAVMSAASRYAAYSGARVRAAATFAPTIINNYPAPERASDSLATALRVARYAVGV